MRAGESVVGDRGAVAVGAGGRTEAEGARPVHGAGEAVGCHRGGNCVVGGAADGVGGQLAVDVTLGYVASDVVVCHDGARGRSSGSEVGPATVVNVVVRVV